VVLRCLRIEPHERHASVVELARELVAFAPESARASLARMEAVGVTSTAAPRASGDGRRARLLAAGGLAIVVVASTWLGAAHAISGHRPKEAAAADRSDRVPPTLSEVPLPAAPAAPTADERQASSDTSANHDSGDAGAPHVPARTPDPISAPPRRTAVVPPIPAPSAQAAPPSCAEPFYIDSRGLKAIRPGCM
jgi:hypothetical protein